MELRRLPADEAAVRRFTEELWLPYNRELEATVEGHALAEDVDVVAEEVEFRLDLLDSESYRAWVAVDEAAGGDDDRAAGGDDHAEDDFAADDDGDLVGFVTTDLDECPSVFDRPDRLLVGDIYVDESYRGTGLARELMARAAERARAEGCPEMTLDVDVDNERAIGFYGKLGFETYRRQMAVPVNDR